MQLCSLDISLNLKPKEERSEGTVDRPFMICYLNQAQATVAYPCLNVI